MTELVKRVPPEPIAIDVPGNCCEVPSCSGVKQYDMVVFLQKEMRLELIEVCGRHQFLWQGYALFFPLWQTRLEIVHAAVQAEYQRRNPPRPVYHNVFAQNFNTTSTGGTFYFYH